MQALRSAAPLLSPPGDHCRPTEPANKRSLTVPPSLPTPTLTPLAFSLGLTPASLPRAPPTQSPSPLLYTTLYYHVQHQDHRYTRSPPGVRSRADEIQSDLVPLPPHILSRRRRSFWALSGPHPSRAGLLRPSPRQAGVSGAVDENERGWGDSFPDSCSRVSCFPRSPPDSWEVRRSYICSIP